MMGGCCLQEWLPLTPLAPRPVFPLEDSTWRPASTLALTLQRPRVHASSGGSIGCQGPEPVSASKKRFGHRLRAGPEWCWQW